MRKLLLALLLLPYQALAGPPERVSGRMVFDDVPGAFLSDVRAGRWDAAYARTSGAFRHYVSRADFPAWASNSQALTRAGKLSRTKPRAGKNCRGEARDVLEIGVCFDGEKGSERLVFAWEDGHWLFDHRH
jgi:hypothetical protein